MGLKNALVSMMGDFVEQKRNPDFRSKTDLSKGGKKEEIDYPAGFNRTRRHSLSITVVGSEPNEHAIRQRTYSVRNTPARRNTIMPESPTKPTDSSVHNSKSSRAPYSTARRNSEPFNARLPETSAPPVIRRPRNLPDRPLTSEESGSETESEASSRQTPAHSPRVFQNSYEKHRFFSTAPANWRSSVLLDEEPIAEENEADAETNDAEPPPRKSTIIQISTPTCS